MTDLYRETKGLSKGILQNEGYSQDKLKEGLFKNISDGRSVVFHITGMWSHVEIHAGVRFDSVTAKAIDAAKKAGWSKDRIEIFRSKIIGCFSEKLGSFCASSEDIGIYCPLNSRVTSLSQVADTIRGYASATDALKTVQDALRYARDKSLLDRYGCLTVPVMARICSDESAWQWSTGQNESGIYLSGDAEYESFLANI